MGGGEVVLIRSAPSAWHDTLEPGQDACGMPAISTDQLGRIKPSIWYIPASDIKMAFQNARKPFNHYWGTRSGYWEPARKATDKDPDEGDDNEEGGKECDGGRPSC